METVIQDSLLHIAACFDVNYRSLLQQMLSAVEQLRTEGVHFDSELPSVLAAHPQAGRLKMADASTASARFQVMADNLVSLLSALKIHNQKQPVWSSLPAKIDRLLDQLNSPPWNIPSNASKRLSPTLSADTLLTEIEILVVELEAGSPPDYRPLTDQIKAVVQSINPHVHAPKALANLEPFNKPVDPFSESEAIYIYNAGLILLWPFFSRLFAALNLLRANQFIEPQAKERAVLLLQFLVDASTEIPEHLLPLNKLLCGLDLIDPVTASLEVTEQEATECENLLLAAIHNWSALKNTTPAGFRQAFLQRAGMLKCYNGNWLLQVEQETYDVLLEQLPWSIRVVKLPWAPRIVYVDWSF